MREEILNNAEYIHATSMAALRINHNLKLDITNHVDWFIAIVKDEKNKIERKGRNYYITYNDAIITLNANSFTLLTAHRI